MKIGVIFALLILFLMIGVSAQPPSAAQTNINIDVGLQIQTQGINILQQDAEHFFQFHVYNISSGLQVDNTTTACTFHLYNKTGISQYESNNLDFVSGSFETTLSGNNFSELGAYSYYVHCNSTNFGGFTREVLEVTQTGTIPSVQEALIYWISFLGILLLFFLSIYFAITLPYRNTRSDDGKILSVNKLKYVKLGFVLISYALMNWILNLLLGLSDFLSLTMYQGLFSFLFLLFTRMAWPFFVVWLIIFLLTIKDDSKIAKLLKKGFRPK